MFKVLLVDDEAIIRKGIKNIINWPEFECIVCGEAGDGIDGMNKIREHKPDIIITDIRMPGIDGLEMIRETRVIVPNAKILLLTGYRNFEYIQKAIKLGAFDYLLKPSKIDDITIAIKKAVNELNSERIREEEVRRLKKSLEEQVPVVKQKLLYDLLFNVNLIVNRVKEETKLCKLVVEDFVLIIIDSNVNEKEEILKKELVYQQGIINSFLDVFSERFYTEFLAISESRIIFIVQPLENMKDMYIEVVKLVSSFKEIVCGCFDLPINSAISSVGSGIWALYEKMKEALKVIDTVNLDTKLNVLNYDNIKELNRNNEMLLNNHVNESKIEESMKIVLRKAIEFIKKNYRNVITLNDVAEHAYVSTYYLSRLFTKEIGKNFVEFLNEIRIEKAKTYLRENNYKTYEVAEMVGIRDAHYFSKLFKKYTGYTPSEYKEKV